MNIQLAKDVIFKDKKIHPILAAMDDDTKNAFFTHFYNYPTKLSFTRVADKSEVKMTIKEFISLLPTDEDGADRLIESFFSWKQRFDGFEKEVLNLISYQPKRDAYLFLRSSTFLNNRESWEEYGIDISKSGIVSSYFEYLNRRSMADESLGKYYIIKNNYDSKILANKFTHQLYNLIRTMDVSGFANGQGFSLVPLMTKYEDVYETPIEEYEVWDGKF